MQNNTIHITKNDGRESPPEGETTFDGAKRSQLGGLDLIEKYFNGETTSSEESQLRQYFRSQKVADELKPYKPLFSYIDEEIEQHKTLAQTNRKKSFSIKRKFLYYTAVAAACAAILISINLFHQRYQFPATPATSFVVIDGRYYADVQLAKKMALEALRNVFVPTATYLPNETLHEFHQQRATMHEQLRELSSIFTE